VAELVKVEEPDDLAACPEEDDRCPVGAEVDHLAERAEGLGHLEHDLRLVPVGEGLEMRRRPVAERLDRDAVAGRRGQPGEDLADVRRGMGRKRGAHGHRPCGTAAAAH